MRTLFLTPVWVLAIGPLLVCTAAAAQSMSASPSRPATPAAASSSASNPANVNSSVTFRAANGSIVTIQSYQPPHKNPPPPPSFTSLDTDGDGSISTSEASAYPPLANDFGYVDHNHNGNLSKAEYAHWVTQP